MRSDLRNFAIGAAALIGVLVALQPVSLPQLASAQQAESGQDKLCTVSGQVVRADTGEPLRKARIALRNADDNGVDPYVAVTDAQGQFRITGIASARYDLDVQHDGFVSESYGEEKPGGSSSLLALIAGQQVTDLFFRLQRDGVITGRVVDEDGDPAEGVAIEAMATRRSRGGEVIPIFRRRAMTNDLGEYRLFDLSPGHYLVRASAERQSWQIIGTTHLDSSTLLSAGEYQSMYYPNVSQLSQATTFDVRAGDEITGVDFTLNRVRSFKIRGRIQNTVADNESGFITVAAVSNEQGSPSEEPRGEVNESTGEFEIDNVPAGSYNVLASYRSKSGEFENSVSVVVANGDVDGVRVVISRGAELHGRVTWDGTAVGSKSLNVRLEPSDRQFMGDTRYGEMGSDGTFSIRGLADGVYQPDIFSECGVCYIKSASADGVDVLEGGLRVSSGSAPSELDLVYSSKTATVEGVVLRDDGSPAPGASVVLHPDRPQHGWRQGTRIESTDQFGHFVAKGVIPGSYHASAWQRIDYDDAEDLEFLKKGEQETVSFSASASETKSLNLKLISSVNSNQ